jgi:hypothetical protein
MRRLWHLFLVLPLLAAKEAHAAEPPPERRGIEYFRVVPGNCIVKSEDLCQVRFYFYWQLFRAEEACIYLHGAGEAVYCSPVLRTGEVALDLAVGETTGFTLMLRQAPQHSLSRSVKVLAIGRDVRLRRRHLWSFL